MASAASSYFAHVTKACSKWFPAALPSQVMSEMRRYLRVFGTDLCEAVHGFFIS